MLMKQVSVHPPAGYEDALARNTPHFGLGLSLRAIFKPAGGWLNGYISSTLRPKRKRTNHKDSKKLLFAG